MNCWFETIAVFAVCTIAVFIGLCSARMNRFLWLSIYIISLLLVLLVNIPMGTFGNGPSHSLHFLAAGRREFVILSFAVVLMFSILMPKLKTLLAKAFLALLIAVSVIYFAIIPFLTPVLIRSDLAKLPTQFLNGICLQSTNFTSGPACAVTALKQFDISAQEGSLAIDSCTTPFWGTDEDLLAGAVEKQYKLAGVSAKVRFFDSVSQLAETCPTIAVVRYSSLVDNYLTIIDVRGKFLIIGDSIHGQVRMSFEDFEKIWRFRGIVISRGGQIIVI
jgi:predicted double-glycine peptidase